MMMNWQSVSNRTDTLVMYNDTDLIAIKATGPTVGGHS